MSNCTASVRASLPWRTVYIILRSLHTVSRGVNRELRLPHDKAPQASLGGLASPLKTHVGHRPKLAWKQHTCEADVTSLRLRQVAKR